MAQTGKLLEYFTSLSLATTTTNNNNNYNPALSPNKRQQNFSTSSSPPPNAVANPYELYQRYLGTLLASGSLAYSSSVQSLTRAVNAAQVELELSSSAQPVDTAAASAAASFEKAEVELKVGIISAGNWLRRFAYERNRVNHWYERLEQQERDSLVSNLEAKTRTMQTLLLEQHSKEHSKTAQLTSRRAEVAARLEREAGGRAERANGQVAGRLPRDLELRAAEDQASNLAVAVAHVESTISLLRFYVRELEDHDTLSLSAAQSAVLERAKALLRHTGMELQHPKWRNPNSLGPFGIAQVMMTTTNTQQQQPWIFLDVDFALHSLQKQPPPASSSSPTTTTTASPASRTSSLLSPPRLFKPRASTMLSSTSAGGGGGGGGWAEELQRELAQASKVCGTYTLRLGDDEGQQLASKYVKYRRAEDGLVHGVTSPLASITIPPTDPTFKLISIPATAKYFCWAYPVVDSKNGVELEGGEEAAALRQQLSFADLFLLLGGYVYFDGDMRVIQCNALVPSGSQLQFSSANELPRAMCDTLVAQNRFRKITLDGLGDATHFAWILPGEFSQFGLPEVHAGAFAYKYEDEEAAGGAENRNNYFVLTTATNSLGRDQAVDRHSLV